MQTDNDHELPPVQRQALNVRWSSTSPRPDPSANLPALRRARLLDLVGELVRELRLDGVTKAWTTQDGRVRQGKPVDKSLIYKLLGNRTYLGELRHKMQWYLGEHEPIVDRKLWDDVQAILATNGRRRGNATRATAPFLLRGLVLGADGWALTPWFTRKKSGRLYRYYLPTRDNKEHAGASGLPRLPAAELEAALLEQLRGVLPAPGMVAEVVA